MKNGVKYILIGFFCLLWVVRFGATAPQAHKVTPGSSAVASQGAIKVAGLYDEDMRAAIIASVYNDVVPFSPAGGAGYIPVPALRVNPYMRLPVSFDVESILSGYHDLIVHTQDESLSRYRALLRQADYYIYTLRKIII